MARTATTPRQTYLVEHYRPGLPLSELRRHALRVRDVALELEREGKPVRQVRSTIVPGDESLLCIFEAASEELVREAYARAGVPEPRTSLRTLRLNSTPAQSIVSSARLSSRSSRSSTIRCAVLAFVLGAVLLAAPPASAYDQPPLLERVASFYAMRPAEVRCPSIEGWVGDPIWGTAPNPSRAWATPT